MEKRTNCARKKQREATREKWERRSTNTTSHLEQLDRHFCYSIATLFCLSDGIVRETSKRLSFLLRHFSLRSSLSRKNEEKRER